MTCSDCRFFVTTKNKKGKCRAKAPLTKGFPSCQEDSWCGDWRGGNFEINGVWVYGQPVNPST